MEKKRMTEVNSVLSELQRKDEERERLRKKKQRWIKTAVFALLACIVGWNVLTKKMIPESRYLKAERLAAEGKYLEAAEIFDKLTRYEREESGYSNHYYYYGYKDSEYKLREMQERIKKEEYKAFTARIETADTKELPALGEELRKDWWKYPDSKYRYAVIGMRLCNAGEKEAALGILEQVTEQPDVKETLYGLASDASKEGDFRISSRGFSAVGQYKDAAMRAEQDTYAYAEKLFDEGQYGASATVFEGMGNFSDAEERTKEARYRYGLQLMKAGDYETARMQFRNLFGWVQTRVYDPKDRKSYPVTEMYNYADSSDRWEECTYLFAHGCMDAGRYDDALKAFKGISTEGYRDAETLKSECNYRLGVEAMTGGKYADAETYFSAAGDFGDSAVRLGDSLAAQKKNESAYKQYVKAGAAEKAQAVAFMIGDTFLTEGKYADAVKWLANAGEYKDAVEKLVSIAEYYYSTRQNELAEKAFMLLPDGVSAARRLTALAERHQREGRAAMAASVYVHAAEMYEAAGAIQEADASFYLAAGALEQEKNWTEAKALYLKIPKYADSAARAKNCQRESELAEQTARRTQMMTPGSVFTFGRYEQDERSGKDPIEWKVLAVEGNSVLVVSTGVLETMRYYGKNTVVTWEKSPIRTELNGRFFNTAFSANERKSIKTVTLDNNGPHGSAPATDDKVFLLSYDEALKYFPNEKDRYVKYSDRAERMEKDEDGYEDYVNGWWLRTASKEFTGADVITGIGRFNIWGVRDYSGIRPAMWLDVTEGAVEAYIRTGKM